MTLNETILSIKGPVKNLLAQMYESKQLHKSAMVVNERNYYAMIADCKPLIDSKYLRITRKGKKLDIAFLEKAKKELI